MRPWLRGSCCRLLVLGLLHGCAETTKGGPPDVGSGGVSGSVSEGGAGPPSSGAGGAAGGRGGAGAAGGASELVSCDPTKILCKRVAPTCAEGEVPSVDASCYGPCVRIERCACRAAEQCPEAEQYTCWASTHCGPFVR